MKETIENPVTGCVMTFLGADDEVFRFSEVARPKAPPPARPGLPAISRRFHEVYFALARAGLTDGKGMPSIWQVAVEMPFVSDHVRLAAPPWPIQAAFLALLRPMGRMLGYRPYQLEAGRTAAATT